MVSDSVQGDASWATSFPQRARDLVYQLVADRLEPTDHHIEFGPENVYVVSYHFIVNNWKAMVSTTLPDGMYYEVTRVLDKKATYITSYKQWEHKTILDEAE